MMTGLKKAWIAYTLAATATTLILLGVTCDRDRAIERLEGNNSLLTQEVERYVTENGEQAASIEALRLTAGQFRQLYEAKAEEVKALGVKVSRLNALSATVMETRVDTVTAFVREVDTLPSMEGRMEWSDPWVRVCAEVAGGTAMVSVRSVDTLTQVVYRVPRRFLGIIPHGTKAIRQEMVSSNPHTQIVYAEYIEITR